jgi:hypothetical protein
MTEHTEPSTSINGCSGRHPIFGRCLCIDECQPRRWFGILAVWHHFDKAWFFNV